MATLTNRANAYYVRTLWEKYVTTNSTTTYFYCSSATSQWNSGYYRVLTRMTLTPEKGKAVKQFSITKNIFRGSSSVSGTTVLHGYIYTEDKYGEKPNSIPEGYISHGQKTSTSLTASKQSITVDFTFDKPIDKETTLYIWWVSTRAIQMEKTLPTLVNVIEEIVGNVRIKVDGVYKLAMTYVKVDGVYKQAQPYIKTDGVYKPTG